MKRFLAVLLGLSFLISGASAVEVSQFQQTATGATLTVAANTTGSTTNARNCLLELTVDGGPNYGPASSGFTFTVASGGSTLYVLGLSTATAIPVAESWPYGHALCGAPGASLTVTAGSGATANYDINASGYVDK